jgi:hypothetical protein
MAKIVAVCETAFYANKDVPKQVHITAMADSEWFRGLRI